MASNSVNIKKLQTALNINGMRIMYCTYQFYSENEDRPITMYCIKQAVWDGKKEKYVNMDLFKSTSQIQIVLFLRDMWYTLSGKELPQDNEEWNKIRDSYQRGDI